MKKLKVLVVTLIAILLLGATAFGWLYLKTDMLRTDKELFYKYVSQINMDNFFDTEFYEQYNNKVLESKYEKNINIDVREIEGGKETEYATIVYNTKNDSKNKLSQTEIEINSQEQSLEVSFLRDGDLYGFIITGILNKYVAIENNNLKELAKEVGLEDTSMIPDKIEFDEYFNKEVLSVSEKEALKELGNKCVNEIISQIPDEKYSRTGKVMIELDASEVEANGYRVSINNEEYRNILLRIEEVLKEDRTILNIINRLNPVESISQRDYEEAIEMIIYDVTNYIDNMDKDELTEEIFRITVYEKNKQFIKLEFEMISEGDTQARVLLEVNNNRTILKVSETIGDSAFSEEKPMEVILKLEKTVTNNESKWEFNLSGFSGETNITPLIITISRSGSLDTNNIKHKSDIRYLVDDVGIVISYNENIKFVTKMQIDKLSDEEYMLLNNMKQEVIKELFTMILQETAEKLGIMEILGVEGKSSKEEEERVAKMKERIEMWETEKMLASEIGGNAKSLEKFVEGIYREGLIDLRQYTEALSKGFITAGNEIIVLEERTEPEEIIDPENPEITMPQGE